MSENPFQAQPPVHNAQTGINGYSPNKIPSALKMICILCIILGTLGLFGSVLGIGGLLFQEQLAEFQMQMADASQHAMQAQMAEAQASFFIPNMFLALCNLLIAPLLLVGGIGVLTKKRWGQKILSLALFAATIFILVRTVLTSFFQVKVFEIMKETMTDQIPAGAQAGTIETIMITSLYFGIAFGIVVTLALAAFYFWGWRYLKKDSCQQYLSTFSA